MANQIQRLEYEGYLVEDPEMRFTAQGKAVCNFRIGSNRQYKTSEGKLVKETIWLRITAWGKLGEIVNQYCGKGSHVVIMGILHAGENGAPSVFQKQDGTWASSYEVTANEVRILKGKEGTGIEASEPEETSSEDIPF